MSNSSASTRPCASCARAADKFGQVNRGLSFHDGIPWFEKRTGATWIDTDITVSYKPLSLNGGNGIGIDPDALVEVKGHNSEQLFLIKG